MLVMFGNQLKLISKTAGIQMADDERTIEIVLEQNEKRYNLTLVLVTIVPWLVCLVCVILAVYGLLWLIGVF